MKIHAVGDQSVTINKLIKKLGHTPSFTITKFKNSQELVKQTEASLIGSDAIIIDFSKDSLDLGYQLCLALEKKKPILALFKKGTKDSFARGVSSDILTAEEYTADTLEKIVSGYLKIAQKGAEKTRFNFFIDKKLENYLDWAAYTYKRNKAEIIRDLLNEQMEKNQSGFSSRLSS